MKGLFITFEGPDGSGKTTQIQKLAATLKAKRLPIVVTREPGGTVISNDIRSILLNPEYNELTHETEILLYAASRAQHVKEKIIPAIQSGHIVLCDRFVDASVAYQGYGYGLDVSVEKVKQINAFASNGLEPDRTYYIDIDPKVARERMLKRYATEHHSKGLDRIEQKQLEYHIRVREGFQKIYEENKQRMIKIDGDQFIESIYQQIVEDFERFLVGYNKN